MDRYVYLLLSLYVLAIVALICWLRADLRSIALRTSFIGGVAGLISEYWYLKDYWRPPSILRGGPLSVEDFLFGAGITGLGATIFKAVVAKRFSGIGGEKRLPLLVLLFVAGVASLVIFTNGLHYNSIFVSSLAFLASAGVMAAIRSDLSIPCVGSGLLLVAAILPAYVVLFDVVSPNFWDRYWLLKDSVVGMQVMGHIPATELLWYFSWGCLAGIAYEFASGKRLVAAGRGR